MCTQIFMVRLTTVFKYCCLVFNVMEIGFLSVIKICIQSVIVV